MSCQRPSVSCFLTISHHPFLPPSLPLSTATITQATLVSTLTGLTETLSHTYFELLKVRLQTKDQSLTAPSSLPPSFLPLPPASITQATLAGTLTGLTETLFHTPFELLKVRLQTKEFAHCPNTYACALEVWGKEGGKGREGGKGGGGGRLRAFYQGWEAYLWRQGAWNGLFFGSIAAIREYYPPPSPPLPPPPPPPSPSSNLSSSSSSSSSNSRRAYDFATGLIAGCVATVVNTPLDVCKTRLQCMTSAAGTTAAAGADAAVACGGGGRGGVNVNTNRRVSLPWVLPFLRQLYQEEGFRACFKGLNARLYRAGPGSGVLLVAYEGIVKFLSVDR